jgi:endonuclease YncB( thermonuclease family)
MKRAGAWFALQAFFCLGLLGCSGDYRHPFGIGVDPRSTHSRPLATGETPKLGTVASVKVTKVFDGDTFQFVHDSTNFQVRLSGIDAPERQQAYADQAKRALMRWTEHQEVRIEVLKIDTYGRLVAKVEIESGKNAGDVSLRLLEQGFAWHFKRYIKDQPIADRERYALAEEAARRAQLGLWAEQQPVAPWQFREQQRAAQKAKG